ncbi:amidohydrolase family protein, partial [candidate division KSB1 bacterium]|nr:amidohydrolase family protein [candidate division KSB1 bacterium]
MQAIRLHTIGSAYAAFEEDNKGSIEDGKLADMVVWSDDYFTVPVSEIRDITLTSVIMNGVVYQNDLSGVTENDLKVMPKNYELYQTFPNPFNGTVSIDYRIKSNRPVPVNLTIYNLMGQKVTTLLDKTQTTGRYHVVWDGKDAAGQTVAGGLYICELRVQKQKQYVKMLYQK